VTLPPGLRRLAISPVPLREAWADLEASDRYLRGFPQPQAMIQYVMSPLG